MSNTIKPPGTSGPSRPDVMGASQSDSTRSSQNETVDFERLLETENTDAAAASNIAQTPETEHLEALDRALQSGDITPEQAIDQMVEQALRSARDLPVTQREALERQLRTALTEDPTLLALQKDLNRGVDT